MRFGTDILRQADALAGFSEDPPRLTRTYLTPQHRQAGNFLLGLMREAGMEAAYDALGNVVGRYRAAEPAAPVVMSGSHMDSVRNAGRYDGLFGILTAIACVRDLSARGKRLPYTFEVIAFGDEEGVRFGVTLTGSKAMGGSFDPAWLDAKDADGVALRDALAAFGGDPDGWRALDRRGKRVVAYVESHIEQGPVLLNEGLPIGVVTAIAGGSRLRVAVTGLAGHAGTVPMGARRDALAAAAEMTLAVERIASAPGREGAAIVGTVGVMQVRPGAINVIPQDVAFTVDVRSAIDGARHAAVDTMRAAFDEIAARRRVTVATDVFYQLDAAPCDPALQDAFAASIARQRLPVRRLPSGAGHDAMVFPPVCPIAMLFVRCGAGGISHHPDETMTAEDADVATAVLLDFLEHYVPPGGAMSATAGDRVHAALDAHVRAHHAEQVAFLREIVRVPSDTPPGDNAPAAARAASLLERLGYAVERHPVPEAFLRGYGMASVVNLVVRQRFGTGGPTIALNAHGDVVPPGEGWTHPPYEGVVEHGRMYGRGVAVSKSDIASYTYALEALKAAARDGARFNGTVELHFTYDEEFGGLAGPGFLLEHGLTRPEYAIAASFSYAIVTAHNGCLQLEVTVHGKAAHGAMPKTGVDALRAANAMITALYAEADRLEATKSSVPGIDCPTLIVGRIEGGINTNVVPDRVVFKLDRRMIPEERPADVEARVRELIEAVAIAHPGIRVDIRVLLLARALVPRPGHEKLVAALRRHGERIFGEALPAVGVPLYSDARLYGEHGVPTVMYGAGPRTLLEANAKRADENLLLDDLRRATQVVASAVADLLS